MVKIPDQLEAFFTASIVENGSEHIVRIPEGVIQSSTIGEGDQYKIALVSKNQRGDSEVLDNSVANGNSKSPPGSIQHQAHSDYHHSQTQNNQSQGRQSQSFGPPVSEGDIKQMEIESLGSKGDGVAKIENGFIVIVPDTNKGDKVRARITDVKENVAFGSVLKRIQ